MSIAPLFPSSSGEGNFTWKGSNSTPQTPSNLGSYAPLTESLNMQIDIPGDKIESHHHSVVGLNRKQQHQQQQQQHHHHHHNQHMNSKTLTSTPHGIISPGSQPGSHHEPITFPSKPASYAAAATGTAVNGSHTLHHRPRQPHSTSDSYFPHSANNPLHSTPSQPPKTPGSVRGHSRRGSAVGVPGSAVVSGRSNKPSTTSMSLSLSAMGGALEGRDNRGDYDNYQGQHHAGPPSPSTLTDIILGLHSTIYGGKRTSEEVRERVAAFYDQDAVFESPLLVAKGRDEIANQFIMAFTLPGMDLTSELRDVICSDFEFDGTRAGIIDQTISVTFLPSLFGSSQSYPSSSGQQHFASQSQHGQTSHQAGASTPGYTLQSAGVTPHPFANYSQVPTPNPGGGGFGSLFSRISNSRPHSPTNTFSLSNLWNSSRPHTPGAGAHSSHIRPFSTSHRPSTPPSVNGDDEEGLDNGDSSRSTMQGDEEDEEDVSKFVSVNEAGGGQVTRLEMPLDAITPHWSANGLGRGSFRGFLWGILHPISVLKSLCTIHLRVMSRLEFNDAGLIVRHEDSWGLRETIEGTIPFASVVYALERRVVGYLCSFAIGKGFKLSSILTRSIEGQQQRSWPLMTGDERYDPDANDAARALLLGSQHNRQEQLHSMARSRASSPSRLRYGIHGTPHPQTISAGTRSRARSLVGQPPRTASSDNLVNFSNMYSTSAYGDRERGSTVGATESLPPNSGAKYRGVLRRTNSNTASAPVSAIENLWQQGDVIGHNPEASDGKSRAPDRDL